MKKLLQTRIPLDVHTAASLKAKQCDISLAKATARALHYFSLTGETWPQILPPLPIPDIRTCTDIARLETELAGISQQGLPSDPAVARNIKRAALITERIRELLRTEHWEQAQARAYRAAKEEEQTHMLFAAAEQGIKCAEEPEETTSRRKI